VIYDASPNLTVKFTSYTRSATGSVGAARAVKLTFQRAPSPTPWSASTP
jgi:hypothetical protein